MTRTIASACLIATFAALVEPPPPAAAQEIIAAPGAAVVAPPPTPVRPPAAYSYYAAGPFPAREYVGFGANDFPFYGRPSGSPSDRWSWRAMRGDSDLARYYYPPVR